MENCLIINGLRSTANCGHKRALAGVVPPHGLPTRFTISTISRQTVKTRISCSLKRFPRTTGQKTVMTCAENVLARTPKLVVPDFSMYKTSLGGGGATWTLHDVHSRWLFQVGIPGVRHSRRPLHMAFPECSFQIVIPEELCRWPFHDTCFHVLNF